MLIFYQLFMPHIDTGLQNIFFRTAHLQLLAILFRNNESSTVCIIFHSLKRFKELLETFSSLKFAFLAWTFSTNFYSLAILFMSSLHL